MFLSPVTGQDRTNVDETNFHHLVAAWFISCQVMVVATLIIRILAVLVSALVFLHFCPILNHEYYQTYSLFGASALEFLVSEYAVCIHTMSTQ